jgi:hypothetical protein
LTVWTRRLKQQQFSLVVRYFQIILQAKQLKLLVIHWKGAAAPTYIRSEEDDDADIVGGDIIKDDADANVAICGSITEDDDSDIVVDGVILEEKGRRCC